MIRSTSLVFLFLISLASTAQVSDIVFSNALGKQKTIPTNTSNQRTAAANKQRLDSIVSSVDKYIYKYDAAGNQTLRIRYEWDNGSNSWIPYNKFEDVYDAAGNATLTITSYWDDVTNVYFPDNKYERVYDVNKNQTSEIMYYWNSSTDIWSPTRKSENTFTSNGKVSSTYQYSWAGSVLMPDHYIEFTYNNKNLLVEETQYSPSPSDFMQSQTIYTYDTDDNLISEISSHYDYNNSEIDSGSKYEYTYDSEKNVTRSVESEWNVGMQDWENTSKTDYEFDLQNNPIAIVQSDWDTQTALWAYSYKNLYSYDNTYALTDLILPEGFDETLKNKLTSIVVQLFIGEEWVEGEEYLLYYTTITPTGIGSATSAADLMVYPNPANDNVFFTNTTNDVVELQLFNAQGQLAYSNEIIMNKPVSLEGMKAGIYFYTVSGTASNGYSGTLIIE